MNKISILKEVRLNKGLSLRDVEKATGLSNAYLSQLETGKVKNPSIIRLVILAGYYKISQELLAKEFGYNISSNNNYSAEALDDGDSSEKIL